MSSIRSDFKEEVHAAFTDRALLYARSKHMHEPAAVRFLVEFARPKRGEKLLDVACGPGTVTLAFARAGCQVTGVDFTERMLDLAREGVGGDRLRVRFLPGDAEALPFPDNSFHLAYSRASFHHFERPEKALDEMSRVTQPGGRVLIADFVSSEVKCKRHYQNRMEKLRAPGHHWTNPISDFEKWASGRSL
ncbi:MAG: class I SAM-dependent methyltransferase, partial [bacterium]